MAEKDTADHPEDHIDDDSVSEQSNKEDATPGLRRTPLLLIDYIQFLAARSIQRHWRGFHFRHMWAKRSKAATVIQAAWRGYMARKNLKDRAETMLQNRIVATFNKSAIKIQAYFRGWMVRTTVHDSNALRKMQSCAAQELLFCVAFKLHYMMRTYQIPGVYSLRNSHCLSRVEKLLTTTRYRFLNNHAMREMSQKLSSNENRRKYFQDSQYFTAIPYKGPNYNEACKTNCIQELARSADVDKRMHKIIWDYNKTVNYPAAEKANRKLGEKKRQREKIKSLKLAEMSKQDFCGDVISSMRRWSILRDKNLDVDKDVFQNPDKLEQFLNECFEILDRLNNCYCKTPA